MSVETHNDAPVMSALLKEWSSLSVGDRRGILRRLPMEQRLSLQRLTTPAAGAPLAEQAPKDRRYRGYSTWLADLLEACDQDTADAARLKPLARRALLDAHDHAAGPEGKQREKPSLSGLVRSLLQGWSNKP